MTTYNHAYTLAFAVPDCKDEDWLETMKNEPEKVLEALARRFTELRMNPAEFMEALEGFDTYEEN